jgi:hypothetical protein
MQSNTQEPNVRRWLIGLTTCFIVVHALYLLVGVRFNDKTLIEVMHFVDPMLLKTRLLESVWYFHIQPPLFNLFVGLVLKITPESPWLFYVIYVACGLCLYLNTFVLQLKLGVEPKLAALLSTGFMASPSFILWEQFLMYTMPVAALVSVAALCLVYYLERRHPVPLVGFFLALFLLCGMRSMFHIGYYIILFGLLVALGKGYRRQVLAVGLVPFLVLFGFYFKNLLLFGEFNVCSFTEKNLWIMTAGNMPWKDKVKLVEEGTLSELSLVNRWASLDAYPDEYKAVPDRFENVPVLANPKKENGAVNYNHYGFIANCNVYGVDAKYVLINQPRHFVVSTVQSWYRYFKSSSALPVSPGNQDHIRPLIAFYDHAIYGKLPFDISGYSRMVEKTGTPPYMFLLLGLPIVLLYGVYRALRPGGFGLTTPQRALLLFLGFNIFMVAALGCAFDYLETSRYRFTTDGMSVVLLGMLLSHVGQRFRFGANVTSYNA